MRVVICAMAKNENLYINDWVKFHIGIGFDMIYLYDNNEINMPNIANFIDKELLEKVNIIDIRGIREDRLQQKTYSKFYKEHTFDWCLFCDIDEFLFGVKDIHEFLSNPIYNDYQQIRVKWKLFGDDGMIERDMEVPVYKAFNKVLTKSLNRNLYDVGTLQKQGKAFVKGNIEGAFSTSPHFFSIKERKNILKSCLPSGVETKSAIIINDDYSKETVFLHHYMTKTLSEFIKQKMNRTDAVFKNYKLGFNYFWRINKKTNEKVNYIYKNMGHK